VAPSPVPTSFCQSLPSSLRKASLTFRKTNFGHIGEILCVPLGDYFRIYQLLFSTPWRQNLLSASVTVRVPFVMVKGRPSSVVPVETISPVIGSTAPSDVGRAKDTPANTKVVVSKLRSFMVASDRRQAKKPGDDLIGEGVEFTSEGKETVLILYESVGSRLLPSPLAERRVRKIQTYG
jgi:hypothetical protein